MLAFGAPTYDGGRVRGFLARLGLCRKINHISHEFKVVDVADELLEISKHAMFSTVDAIPVPSEGLVHQLMTETCYDSGERMKIVH